MNKFSAVIFDLDGTIVDDHEFWKKAFFNVADRHKIQYSMSNVSWPEPGRSLVFSWQVVGESEKALVLARETRDEFMELIEDKESLEPREGFLQLVAYLKEKGYVLGLATSSFWEVADLLLEKMGLSGIFEAMTTGEEVMNLKPDPEIYLLTCQKLGVEPEEVVVFEDAEVGMAAAVSAGCEVIRVGENFDFMATLKIFDKIEI